MALSGKSLVRGLFLASCGAAMVLLTTIFITGCNNEQPVDKSESDTRYRVDACVEVVDKDGDVVSSTDLRSSFVDLRASVPGKVETDKGVITGLGYFDSGRVTTVSVTAKQGYKYKGMYFRYSSSYDARSYPKSVSSALSASSKSITVVGNITVVALFEKDDSFDVVIE